MPEVSVISGSYPAEIWPAPMEGVMTPALIRAVAGLGLVERWMTPFWRVTSSPVKRRKLAEWIAPFIESGVPVTAQLMGDEAGMILKIAEELLKLGATGINLNFGCPSGQVLRHGCGGAMLKRQKEIIFLIKKIKENLPGVPLSIKIRCGFDWPDLDWLKELSREEVDKIFFHYRLVKEGYSTFPFDFALKRFAIIRETIADIPIIANGDIDSAEKMTEVINLGFDGIMTGRGWLKNPSILKELSGHVPSKNEFDDWRYALFAAVLEEAAKSGFSSFSRGNAIELSALMWGAGNEVFRELIKFDGKMTDFATDFKSKYYRSDGM